MRATLYLALSASIAACSAAPASRAPGLAPTPELPPVAQPEVAGSLALPTDHLRGVRGDETGVVCAIGEHGAIVRSGDRGVRWSGVERPVSTDLTAIASPRAGEFWITGKAGTILRSTDGCRSFVIVDAGTVVDFSGVWGRGSEIYIVGGAGLVLRVRDDGKSFDVQEPLGKTDEQLTGVWGSGPGDVYVVGDRGSILTTDGSTWTARLTQTERPKRPGPGERERHGGGVWSIVGTGRGSFVVTTSSWIWTHKGSSSGGSIARTRNGGVDLEPVVVDPTPHHYADWSGLLGVDGGLVYGFTRFETEDPTLGDHALIVSTDGGSHFLRRGAIGVYALALWREPTGELVAVGASGMIKRSIDDGLTWSTTTLDR